MADTSNPLESVLRSRFGAPDQAPAAAADDGGDPVSDAMQALMAAIDSKDPSAAADAFRQAFSACQLEPHMEAAGEQG